MHDDWIVADYQHQNIRSISMAALSGKQHTDEDDSFHVIPAGHPRQASHHPAQGHPARPPIERRAISSLSTHSKLALKQYRMEHQQPR
jgi:hypothetical protein